jgi:hypothetical protein
MLKVGGEIDAFCTRCQLSLAHTVHAVVGGKPVKVECNTCHSVHRNRGGAGASRATAAGRPSPARAELVPFDALLASKRASAAAPYSPQRAYAMDDVVDHPVFGRGFVSAVRDPGKVEITFRAGARLLVQGRG